MMGMAMAAAPVKAAEEVRYNIAICKMTNFYVNRRKMPQNKRRWHSQSN